MPIRVKCTGCQKIISAPDKFAGKTAKCPGCGATISIPSENAETTDPPNNETSPSSITKPPGRPSKTHVPEPEHERDLFDVLLPFALCSIVVVVVVAIGGMLFGNSDIFLFLGALCLIISLLLTAKFSQLRVSLRNASEKASHLEGALETRNADLSDATDKYLEFDRISMLWFLRQKIA